MEELDSLSVNDEQTDTQVKKEIEDHSEIEDMNDSIPKTVFDI